MFRRPRRAVPIALAIVAVLVAAAFVNREASRTGAAASANEAVLGTLEARFAVSHTWVEEYVIGDEGVDVDADIRANQADAAQLCRTLQDGGTLPRHGRVDPVDDAAVSARVGDICRGIAEFRRLTAGRIADPRRQPAGSPGEQRYDVRFAAVIGDADALRIRLEEVGEESRLRTRATEILILVVLALLLLRAILAIRGREHELAALAADREAVLNSAGEGILAIDREGLVQFANATAGSALGWPRGELVGRPFVTLLPEASESDPEHPLPQWMRVQRPTHGDDRELRRRDGSRFPVEYSLTPARAREDGGSLVLTFQNIERRRLLDAQRDAELGELRTIKEALVPDAIPDRAGLEIATCHVPAEEGVAGDFHLVADGPEGRTTFFVGDVAGKGLAAARRGAYLRAALATFAPYEAQPGAPVGARQPQPDGRGGGHGALRDASSASSSTRSAGRRRGPRRGIPRRSGSTPARRWRALRAFRSGSRRRWSSTTRRWSSRWARACCSTPTASRRRASTATSHPISSAPSASSSSSATAQAADASRWSTSCAPSPSATATAAWRTTCAWSRCG